MHQDRASGAQAHIQRHYTTSAHGVHHVVSSALRRSIADAYAAVVAQVGARGGTLHGCMEWMRHAGALNPFLCD